MSSHHSLRDCCFFPIVLCCDLSQPHCPPSGSLLECLPPAWVSCFGRLWKLLNVRSLAVGLLQFPIATTTVHPPVVSSTRPSFVSPIPLKPYLSTFFRTVGKYLKYLILRSSYQDPGFSQRFGSAGQMLSRFLL